MTGLLEGEDVLCTLAAFRAMGVLAEGPALNGVVKTVDPAANSMTLVMRPPRGTDAGEERIVAVTPEAVVLLDDGRGRRLSIKPGKLADMLVLDANPVDDIKNTRRISMVVLRGSVVDRSKAP